MCWLTTNTLKILAPLVNLESEKLGGFGHLARDGDTEGAAVFALLAADAIAGGRTECAVVLSDRLGYVILHGC